MIELNTILIITGSILILYSVFRMMSFFKYKKRSLLDIVFQHKELMWILLTIHVGVLLLHIGKEFL